METQFGANEVQLVFVRSLEMFIPQSYLETNAQFLYDKVHSYDYNKVHLYDYDKVYYKRSYFKGYNVGWFKWSIYSYFRK